MKRAPAVPEASRAPSTESDRPAGGGRALVPWIIGGLALGYGVLAAIRKAWLCDDAFISFRYAENLTRGLGLVYNAGERVEGYSNFLWTLWIAFGMRLGASPESWSVVWGVVFYAATLLILLIDHVARERGSRSSASEPTTVAASESPPAPGPPAALVPLAVVLAAVHPDWHRYATSGLETSFFTFLVTAGYLLVVRAPGGLQGLAVSGFVFGLAALTRPDGLLFAALAGGYVAWAARPRLAGVAAFAGAFLVAWLPYAIWKVAYYGEFLPNTYYAKSAYLPWYEQGWHYVRLYFQRYWSIAASVPIAALALVLHARDGRQRPLALALGLGMAYTVYVMQVGGDFMYARFLVPATPFLILALAGGLERLCIHRHLIHGVAAMVLVMGVVLTPSPLRDAERVHGIVDEPSVYRPEILDRTRADGLVLRRYFDGLPVRIAIVGSQAALAYYARPAVVIEGGSGLTDRWIARQPLVKRGRVGHEKLAPVSYLLERRVHFTIRHFAGEAFDLDSQLPMAAVAFDTVPGRIVHWDPVMLAEIKRRGANFTDVPSALDGEIAALDQLTDEEARDTYARLKRFYFNYVHDPVRERAFRERAERGQRSP